MSKKKLILQLQFIKQLQLIFFISILLISCQPDSDSTSPTLPTRFVSLPMEKTGIDFRNDLVFDSTFNIYTYRNFYNGGGVGIGDFNNDGLEDIYFTSNQKANQLYLNEGDFKFRNITKQAGVGGTRKWSTGVAVADVNNDGWLDIYVCNSGDVNGDDKQNELFLNNGLTNSGGITFTEAAAKFGLADLGHSTHAAFFDYDKDGDLDLYLLNNSYRAIGSFNLRQNDRPVRDTKGGDKFFKNNNLSDEQAGNTFTDISEEAGIYGSIIGFGLGVTVGDVNLDGYEDIYVSNDFFERDYLYINQQDGTFRESLTSSMNSISSASMGADMADLNNDGYPEIFVTDMLPRNFERYQTKTTFEDWNKYQYNLKHDYYHQFTRNSLQWNHGNGTFSEVSRMANVAATDWSWGALLFDMDMDGYKDIFVANGIYQDLTDQDYIRYAANRETARDIVRGNKVDFKKLIEAIPSEPISNCVFKNPSTNTANLRFKEVAESWGLSEKGFSNGAAYADFDNDGDYDLVVNNTNATAWVFQNNTSEEVDFNFVKIKLEGDANNPFAIGSKVLLYQKNEIQIQQLLPQKGFQSSVGFPIIFGLGKNKTVDSIVIQWSDQTQTTLENITPNKTFTIQKSKTKTTPIADLKPLEKPFFQKPSTPINFKHQENSYSDFDRDQLAFMMRSTKGPAAEVGDVNGDGLDDIFLGGAKDQAAQLFLQKPNGKFFPKENKDFQLHKKSEDVDAQFFDADNDGDLDLYVCSGGSEFSSTSLALYDRLYFNDGIGNFTDSKQKLPSRKRIASSCVAASDFDKDGDLDLFVGENYQSFQLGVPRNGWILMNNGKGIFQEQTQQRAPDLKNIGMVTDAVFMDLENDGDDDLVVVGEWMGVHIFKNENGNFREKTILENTTGIWNSLKIGDFNQDGFLDFVAGNLGWNSAFKIDETEGVHIYVNNFDGRGGVESVFCKSINGQHFPFALKHDLEKQLPFIKRKFTQYEDFKGKTVEEIFGKALLEKSLHFEMEEFSTCVFINNQQGGFEKIPLPYAAQMSPTFAIETLDANEDGQLDILLAGNLSQVKPEIGNYQSQYGSLLLGDGQGNFESVSNQKSGLILRGDVRGIIGIDGKGKFVIARNNDLPLMIEK